MALFLSLDWGTSALRLRLVQEPELIILAEVISEEGISKTFAAWQAAGKENDDNRSEFYFSVIKRHLQQLETNLPHRLSGIPMVISGMASASIGLRELPYQPVPFSLDGFGLKIENIPLSADFNHDVYLVSGVRTENDVMRGEETQLIGFAAHATSESQEQVYIFPGTHSKHIWVKEKKVIGFKTYMTGEFFSLLWQYSILKNSVAESSHLTDAKALTSFNAGVEAAQGANIIQVAFQVRTNEILNKVNKAENLHFLSGLLIGSELGELANTPAPIYLCGGANLHKLYAAAFQKLKLPQAINLYPPQLADEAVIRGQYQILKSFKQPI